MYLSVYSCFQLEAGERPALKEAMQSAGSPQLMHKASQRCSSLEKNEILSPESEAELSGKPPMLSLGFNWHIPVIAQGCHRLL